MYNLNNYLCELSSVYNLLGELYGVSGVLFLLFFIVLPKKSGRYTEAVEVQKLTISLLIFWILVFGNNWLVWDLVPLEVTGFLKVDSFSLGVKTISLVATLFIIILWKDFKINEGLTDKNNGGETLILLLGSLGVLGLASGNDLLSIYLAMELQALSFYSLAAMKREEEASTEAGLKYFVLGALASGIYLFGASLIYGGTGLTNIDSLKEVAIFGGQEAILVVGSIFIFIGLVFKVGGAPFHAWLPDVYQGSPTIITAYFSIVPKLAILTLMIRLLPLDPQNHYLGYFFGFCALLSMIIGCFGALNQSIIKRLFAYSAISHVGYLFICFLSGVQTQSSAALVLYMLIYMLTSINLFTIILGFRKQLNRKSLTYIIELFALSRAQPLLTISLALVLFSLAGVPPLAGFFSKWFVFTTAIQSGWYLIATLGILTSVVASVYYLKLVSKMYMDSNSTQILLEVLSPIQRLEFSKSIILGSTLYLILFILFIPTPLLLLCQELTAGLF